MWARVHGFYVAEQGDIPLVRQDLWTVTGYRGSVVLAHHRRRCPDRIAGPSSRMWKIKPNPVAVQTGSSGYGIYSRHIGIPWWHEDQTYKLVLGL